MQKFIMIKSCRQIILNWIINERFDKINCKKRKKKYDWCQIKKLISVKKRKEKKKMLMIKKIIKENKNELKIIEFEQEMKWWKELTFKKMKLQLIKMLKILMLKKKLKKWKKKCQEYKITDRKKMKCENHSIWNCERKWADMIRKKMSRLKKMIKWKKFLYCF